MADRVSSIPAAAQTQSAHPAVPPQSRERVVWMMVGCAVLVAVSAGLAIWLAPDESLRRILRGGQPLQPQDLTLSWIFLGVGVGAVMLGVLWMQREEIALTQHVRARRAHMRRILAMREEAAPRAPAGSGDP